MEVELIGDLDIVLHCNEDVVVTLRDVAYIPGLWGELISFNVIQDHHTILLESPGRTCLVGVCGLTRRRTTTSSGLRCASEFPWATCHGGTCTAPVATLYTVTTSQQGIWSRGRDRGGGAA